MYDTFVFKFEGFDLVSSFLIGEVLKFDLFAGLAFVDLSNESKVVSHFNSFVERI